MIYLFQFAAYCCISVEHEYCGEFFLPNLFSMLLFVKSTKLLVKFVLIFVEM